MVCFQHYTILNTSLGYLDRSMEPDLIAEEYREKGEGYGERTMAQVSMSVAAMELKFH